MKLDFLFLIALFGMCKANWRNGIAHAVLNEKAGAKAKTVSACTVIKMQQCLADLLKSAPLLLWYGEKSVEPKSKKEFNECLAGLASCVKTLFPKKPERSQRQKDFCGDDEDCYDDDDDDEEDEDNYPRGSLMAFLHCLKKPESSRMIFESIGDIVLDAFGYIRNLMFHQIGSKYKTPNTVMCDAMRKYFKTIMSISKKKCGSGGESFWPMVLLQMKKQSLVLFETCSLGSVLETEI